MPDQPNKVSIPTLVMTAAIVGALAGALGGLVGGLIGGNPGGDAGALDDEEERPPIIISSGSIILEGDFDSLGGRPPFEEIDNDRKTWYSKHTGTEPAALNVMILKSTDCGNKSIAQAAAVTLAGSGNQDVKIRIKKIPKENAYFLRLDFKNQATRDSTMHHRLTAPETLTSVNVDGTSCALNANSFVVIRQVR